MTGLEAFTGPPLDAIPFYVDERVPEVYYVAPMPRQQCKAWGFMTHAERVGYLVGSMQAWGAMIAYNFAAAYRPEGVS
jgi:hypothetical protein